MCLITDYTEANNMSPNDFFVHTAFCRFKGHTSVEAKLNVNSCHLSNHYRKYQHPSFTTPTLQSKGTVSTRQVQDGTRRTFKQRKGGGKGPTSHLHSTLILIYTGCQTLRSEFSQLPGQLGCSPHH